MGRHREALEVDKAPALLYRARSGSVDHPGRVHQGLPRRDHRRQGALRRVKGYVEAITPALADRIEHYDEDVEGLPLFERQHIDEQLRKALDRKVWLPGGGSLIIEGTEALTVIDVNTGKNVGKSCRRDGVPQ